MAVAGDEIAPITLSSIVNGINYNRLCYPDKNESQVLESVLKTFYENDGMKYLLTLER